MKYDICCNNFSSIYLRCSGRAPKEETTVNEMLASSSKIFCACNFAFNIICNLFAGILGTVSKKRFSLSVYYVMHTGDWR